MPTISLCMIVKNEEDTLKRCLESVGNIADEIVIVDTGSSDATKEIARQFTNKVFDFAWTDDFSAARNYSYEQAEMDYILWLDADDIILPEDAVKFMRLKENLTEDTDVVMIRYNTAFDTDGSVVFSFYRERLSRRERGFRWREPVHEYLEVWGRRISCDVCITHAKPGGRDGDRNISIYENLLAGGSELSVRGMYYYARELADNERWREAIQWFCRFLDTGSGWLEDNIAACGKLAICYIAENQPDQALAALFRSFSYDTPRAEICCQLGYYFKNKRDYRQAAFWFGLILSLDRPEDNTGFRNEECWGYIPCMELAVCYDKLGEYQRASEFNEKALCYKPGSAAAAFNREYFKKILAVLASEMNSSRICHHS